MEFWWCLFDLLSWSRYGSLFWINPSDDSCCEPNKVLGMVHHWIHVLVFICKEDHLKTHMNGGCSFRIVTGNHTVSICCSWLSDSKKSTAGNVPAVFLLIPGAQSMMPLGKRSRGECLVEVWPAWPSQRILMWFPIESTGPRESSNWFNSLIYVPLNHLEGVRVFKNVDLLSDVCCHFRSLSSPGWL